MVDPSIVQHVQLKQYLYHKAAMQGIPITVNFELSPICNFSCKMCYVRQTEEQVKKHSRPMMRLEEWIHLAEQLKQKGTLYILLTGGEPLLWPDFWELYETLYNMGFLLLVNTNGSLIEDTVIQRFKKMPPNQVNITLYGGNDVTYYNLCGIKGVFETVTHAIEALHEAGILVRINGTITPENADDLDQMIAFAKKCEVPIKTTTYMFPPVRRNKDLMGSNHRFTPDEAAANKLKIAKLQMSQEQYRLYLEMILSGSADPIDLDEECMDGSGEKMQCIAGRASCWMTWDGYMGLCGMIPDYYIDLKNTTIETAWAEMKKLSEEIRLSVSCKGCSDHKLCHTCAAIAYAETGSTDGKPSYACDMTKAVRILAEKELKEIHA